MWAGILIGTSQSFYGMQFSVDALWLPLRTKHCESILTPIWASVEEHGGPPWYYILEILKYTWPTLIFLPQGLGKTWENRNLSQTRAGLEWRLSAGNFTNGN